MKKTFLILSALLLTAVGASAQTTDVTATYIKNASFEYDDVSNWTVDGTRASEEDGVQTGAWTVTSLSDWTLTGASNFDVVDLMTEDAKETDNNLGVPGEAADGTYMLYLKKTWANSLSAAVKQTITLPVGAYKLTVDSKCFSGGSSANLVAGSASNAITINGTSAGSETSHPMTDLTEWTTNELIFTVTPEEDAETAEVEIGVEFTLTNTSPGSFVLDNFKLYSYDYNVTNVLANPSFEVDDPATEGWELDYNDSEGSTPRASEGKGAWVIPDTGLTGWNLNGSVSVKDIMSADAAATDNDFGAPGTPSDGTYMLYLRDSWSTEESTVLQSIVLPAGEYVATVDTKCVSTGSTATLVVGEASVALTINSTMPEGWDTAVLGFSLEETTAVSLGVVVDFSGANGSFLLDNFQLFSTKEVETVEYNYDVTWELANPSFEVDNVAYLTEDATRSYTEDNNEDSYTGGAYTIANGLTGWTLGGNNAVSDLMTGDCQRTDNNFGAPGTPTDGTQMLYLRANTTATGSVEQTITLPAGEYMLTVDTKCVSTGSSTAKLVAGEKSTALTIHTESSMPSAWDTAELVLSLDAETEVTVGVDISYSGNGSFLLDNFKLYAAEEIEESISWEMTTAGWGTLILPFAASVPEGLTAYSGEVITLDEDGTTLTVGDEATTIVANTPYLVKGEVEQDTNYTFSGTPTNEGEIHTTGVLTGTLVDLAIAQGAALATDGTNYVLQNHTDDGEGLAFYPITSDSEGVELDAYHCYLTIESEDGEPAKLSIVLPGAGEETGIVAVECDVIANDAIYDLSGRRVAKAVKGVYIQNGKKVLVK